VEIPTIESELEPGVFPAGTNDELSYIRQRIWPEIQRHVRFNVTLVDLVAPCIYQLPG
jgi:hypothetical protein